MEIGRFTSRILFGSSCGLLHLLLKIRKLKELQKRDVSTLKRYNQAFLESDHCAQSRLNLGDEIVLGLDSGATRSNSPKTQTPRFRNFEIPGFAGSLALKAGACTRAACWFESHFILYSYMAILEVIS